MTEPTAGAASSVPSAGTSPIGAPAGPPDGEPAWIAQALRPPPPEDHVQAAFSGRRGALFKLLEPFRRAGVSLTRIDTRPSRTEKWAYVFFIEFEGHLQDPAIAAVVAELEEQSILLKPLGSYPRAVL